MSYKEGDIVRVRSLKNDYWSGTWRVSSVMERPPLAYVREVNGIGKGYIELRALVPVDEHAPAEVGAQLTIF